MLLIADMPLFYVTVKYCHLNYGINLSYHLEFLLVLSERALSDLCEYRFYHISQLFIYKKGNMSEIN